MYTMKELLKNGLVEPQTVLVWNRTQRKIQHEAVILSDGLIQTEDGKKHKTPSGAAKHLNSDKPIDGWNVWKIKSTGVPLNELRNSLHE
jgi:hypothetical protein